MSDEREQKALQFVRDHGSGIDFGGCGSSRADRKAVERLIERGELVGSYRDARLPKPRGAKP